MNNPKITWASFIDPCYNPQRKYGDCPDSLMDLMNDERIPLEDRIWAFAKCEEVSDLIKLMFAVRCVRETPIGDGRFVFDLLTDPRSIRAVEVAEAYAKGEAIKEDLDAAWDAAMDAASAAASAAARAAARDAAWDAAWDAASAAASAAAWDAAMDAAMDAARAAASAAAWDAARDAARAAASGAAWDAARAAARDAARDAAWDAQFQIIKSFLQ
jgi:hypothetical protein